MNFSFMEEFGMFIMVGVVLYVLFLLWVANSRRKCLQYDLEKKDNEIKLLEEKLKLKEQDFEIYKHTYDLEKIQTAEDISKSLFVLDNKPKFEKGYNCDEFFVIEVIPKIIYNTIVEDIKGIGWLPKDKLKYFVEGAATLITIFGKYYSNDIKKFKIDQIKEKAFEVYYSYTVFSKLDQKTMVVREEYLEAFRENHMQENFNTNQIKS